MKKTVTANIGSIVFHIDEDAYEALSLYLTSIRRRYQDAEGYEEILQDIETRIAEILQMKLTNSKQVVVMKDVDEVIDTLGRPEQFEEDSAPNGQSGAQESGEHKYRKLYRDDEDKVLAGVCSGIASYFHLDPVWVRIAFIVGTIIFFTGVWVYLVLWIIVPKARTTREKLEMQGKKINISNIEQSIKEDLNDLKSKFKDFKEEAKDTLKKKRKDKHGAEKFLNFVFVILRYFAKSVGILVGLFFIFLGIFLLIGIISSFFTAFPFQWSPDNIHFIDVSVPALLDMLFPSVLFIYIAIIGLIFLLVTPLIILVYYGVKLVFGFKYRSKLIGFTSFSLWMIGLVLCMVSAFQVVRSFSSKGLSVKNYVGTLTENQTLIVDVEAENAYDDVLLDESIRLGALGFVTDTGGLRLYGEPRIEVIKGTLDDGYEVKVYYTARGEDKTDALKHAAEINYVVDVNDTVITLPRYFWLPTDSKWRIQDVKVQILLPVSHEVFYTQKAADFIEELRD